MLSKQAIGSKNDFLNLLIRSSQRKPKRKTRRRSKSFCRWLFQHEDLLLLKMMVQAAEMAPLEVAWTQMMYGKHAFWIDLHYVFGATKFVCAFFYKDSETDVYLTTNVPEDMMEFRLSYEMWRVGKWAVRVTNVRHTHVVRIVGTLGKFEFLILLIYY